MVLIASLPSCSRNGLEVSLSGRSRFKKYLAAALMKKSTKRHDREDHVPRASRKCLAYWRREFRFFGDHPANLLHSKFAAIENRFAFISRRASLARLNSDAPERNSHLIGKSG